MRGAFVVVVGALAVSSARGQESLPLNAVAAIKAATVLITTADGAERGSGGSGTGFVIRVEGQTAYIVTNNHVISPTRDRAGGRLLITVVLRCGAHGERKLPAEIVAAAPESDLAILKVTGVPDLPAPIDVLQETEPVETMPVYVFGFPFGQTLAAGRGNPSVVVGKGSVSSVRLDADGQVSVVLIDGALNPGNSGGPVVNAQGRLVGVAVAAIQGANIGFVIPRRELLAVLAGRPEALHLSPGVVRGGTVELAVDVPLLDPFDNLKKISLRYAPGAIGGVKPRQQGQEISWDPLPGGTTIELKIGNRRARGSLAIAVAAGKDVELTYQVRFENGGGQARFTKPGCYFLAVPQATGPDGFAAAIRPWGEFVDPDGDCKIKFNNGALSLEVPGTLHDLTTAMDKVNAPLILQQIEGDFIARVKVCGEFQPNGPATRAGGIPFNGAGLVLWLDADHFIRIERAAVRRDDGVGAYLLIERHDRNQPMVSDGGFIAEGNVCLKVERRGAQISAWYGTDGLQWVEAQPIKVPSWPARLKVGLDAISTSSQPFTVRFEEFAIRKPGSATPK
jgi:regulation of enolase protein 1 (concanavalin A-like superfamily)